LKITNFKLVEILTAYIQKI